MKIALVDDDCIQRTKIADILAQILEEKGYLYYTLDNFSNGDDFLRAYKQGSYDMVILDIFMDGMTGIEIAQEIRDADPKIRLAFCTSSNEFAAESYEVNAQYYLCKPVTTKGLTQMLERLEPEHIEQLRVLTLPDGYQVILRKILYTDYHNHVVTFYLKDKEIHRIRFSQSEAEQLLLPYPYFFSPIKGIILNFYETVRLEKDLFLMSDGKAIPVARRKSKEAQNTYTRFRFDKMRQEVEC